MPTALPLRTPILTLRQAARAVRILFAMRFLGWRMGLVRSRLERGWNDADAFRLGEIGRRWLRHSATIADLLQSPEPPEVRTVREIYEGVPWLAGHDATAPQRHSVTR